MSSLCVLFDIFCIFAFLPASLQDYAGIKVQLSQKGLDYGADLVVDLLMEQLNQKTLNDITGKKGSLKYEVTNIKIDELSRPEFTASFNEEQQLMRWSLSNSRITASADWKYDWKKNRIIRLKDSGSLVVSANDISMIIDWKLKYDSSTGRPIIETTHCESKVGNINLDLKGKASFVYNMILRYAKKPLDRNIKLAMCAEAEKALNENANEEMKTMEVVIELNEDLIFNFKLVSPPHITNSHIESFHSGCTYTNENEDCPNDHAIMTKDAGNRMLSLSLSANVINNLMEKAFENGAIQASINSEDSADKTNNFFDTNCKATLCMKSFFKKLVDKHLNSKFEIDFAATAAPSLTMHDSQIKSTLEAIAKVYIRKADNERIQLFTTSIVTDFDLSVRIDDGNVLIGEIVKFNPKFSLVDITTEDTSGKKVEFLGKIIGKMLVKKANNAA